MPQWENLDIPQLDGFTGFVPPSGTGSYKVALFGEAAGEMEARHGVPFYEKAPAGSVLTRLLRRAGLDREGFIISNACWSRPPGNYLDGARYEGQAISAYQPFRDRLFEVYRPRVLVALGGVALRTLSTFGSKGATITQVQGYVLDGPYDGTHVIGCLHPSAILRGEQRMSGVVIWALQRALDIARNGFIRLPTRYITHPSLDDALTFERAYSPDQHILSYDIETPESSSLDEEQVEDREQDVSYQINRISLCYTPGQEGYAISLPWAPPFIEVATRMLSSAGPKRVWNGNFDNPRLTAAKAPVLGRVYDTMWAWKFLQPTLPRSLGFVAPFYNWTGEPWKHTSDSEPEKYSCQDAHALQLIGDGVDAHLRQKGQWHVYERHVVELSEVLTQMSHNGLPYSREKAADFERELQAKWDERYATLQSRVPNELKPAKQKSGYKKLPKDTTGLVIRKFNVLGQDLTEAERGVENANRTFALGMGHDATDFDILTVERWCLLEPFLPTSWQQLIGLIRHYGYQPGTHRKTKQETTDDDTLKKLLKKARSSKKPRDQEFAAIIQMCRECRQLSKVLGTYIKGWRPGADGRIHGTPGYWGDNFRVHWRRPNLAGVIQDKNEESIAKGFRRCVTARDGYVLVEADWKGLEAVLVGYFAGDEEYMRLAKLGVHDYVTYLVLADKGKIPMSDVPDLSLSDDDLTRAFRIIKKQFPKDRDDCKHIVHGSNYLGTARYLADLYELREALVKEVQASYFARFSKLVKWQRATTDRASREAKLRNAWGCEMPFWEVHKWDSKYQRWVYGDDAKSAVSFLPRDSGACMLKDALLRLRPLADQGTMLVCAHDAILCECREADAHDIGAQLKEQMELPVPELSGLVIPVELKCGRSWHDTEMETLALEPVCTS